MHCNIAGIGGEREVHKVWAPAVAQMEIKAAGVIENRLMEVFKDLMSVLEAGAAGC